MKSKSGSKSTSSKLLEAAQLPGPEGVCDILDAHDHDPLAALIQVAKGDGGVEQNATALAVVEFLRRVSDAAPGIAAQCGLLIARVRKHLIYYVDQREVDKINLALLEYQKAKLKAVDPKTGDSTERGDYTVTIRYEDVPRDDA